MEFRTRFTKHDTSLYSFDQGGQESMTRQSEAAEADINVVMERFMRTGQLPQTNHKQPRYGDAVAMPYDKALMVVKQAEEAFMSLPAKVRKEFFNDPAELESFLSDSKNDARAVELGLKEIRKPDTNQLLTEVVKNTKKVDEKPKPA